MDDVKVIDSYIREDGKLVETVAVGARLVALYDDEEEE